MKADVVVVGAGIVGCAIALHIKSAYPSKQVVVLEKHREQFQETSRYNSGVIHSGIHQKPELLKSQLAYSGGPKLIAFCEQEGIPHRKAGMIVAVHASDLFGLWSETLSLVALFRNSRRLSIPLRPITGSTIRKMEPAVRASFGLYMPDIWVVDQVRFGERLRMVAEEVGVQFRFNECVILIARRGSFYRVLTEKSGYDALTVINAAGLRATQVARLAGFKHYRTCPYRGEYYEIMGSKRDLIHSTLIYPALRPGSPVKGIHLTKTVDGRLLIGPNASSWNRFEDDFMVRTPPDEFLKGAQKFLPDLEMNDIRWAYSGIRSKTNRSTHEDDFIIHCDSTNPTFINLIGIESPGFTASFAIAEYVLTLM